MTSNLFNLVSNNIKKKEEIEKKNNIFNFLTNDEILKNIAPIEFINDNSIGHFFILLSSSTLNMFILILFLWFASSIVNMYPFSRVMVSLIFVTLILIFLLLSALFG